ncbi:MAG: alpha/beta hydrolase, partial [Saprospiraceae bacterium]|nr:alpha/beta hydrolase [Saprospiraceae bacterium]
MKNEGAIMPVNIRGNSMSKEYIVLLPGGPSGDGLIYSKIFPEFKRQMEAHCKMVYYDQRGAGSSQGVYDTSTLNLSQLAKDLEKIILTIKERDRAANIFLLGYSYGGALGLSYLKGRSDLKDVEGFISISGAFDRKHQEENQRRLLEYLLEKWVQEGKLANYDALKNGFSCHDAVDIEGCRQDSIKTVKLVNAEISDLEKYGRFRLKGSTILGLLGYMFFSPGNPIQSGIAEGQNGQYFQKEFDGLDLREDISGIKTPILLVNGRFDTNVPFFEAQEIFDKIGTPVHQKKILILE